MSRARDFADLAGSADAGGLTGRNLIINGAMKVAQRGTSATGVTTHLYLTADRFKTNMSDAGTFTVSQSDTVPAGQGFSNSLKFDCTTADASVAAGSYMAIDHRIEAQNLQRLNWGTSSAKKLTISFWVRSNLTGTFVFEILHGETTVYNSNTYTIDSANTWEKKTITISGYTPTAINDDNGIGLYCFWWLQSGSTYSSGTTTNDTWHSTQANRAAGQVALSSSTDNEFYLTGVQLEVGDTATPFEHEDFGTTLAKCQRYYYKTDMNGAGTSWHPNSLASGTGYLIEKVYYPVAMRASPTGTTTATSGSTFSGSAPYFSIATTTFAAARYDVTATTGGYASITSFILDAEL